jgi:DNA repair exonuclease SbcCD ATPase subunit
LEKQLDALKDRGPSQRTRELAAAIERLNKAERERGYNRQLSDLRERKHLLVLEKELRARKEQIDISKYSGKERVVAIDAEMDRLQRRSDEQERFNHLLDLQYQLTRRQVRQEGESIQEFIERRAQENRHILEEAAQIQVDRQKAILEKQKETAQLEVEIEQAKEDIKELIRQHALEKELERLQKLLDASRERDARLLEADRERLQKLLEASKKHDQEVLEAKREALQKQIEAVRENAQQQIEVARDQADKDIQSIERRRDAAIAAANRVADLAIAAEKRRAAEALRILEQTEDERIRLAIAGSKTVADLQGLAGYIAGLNYAEGQLRALFGTYGVDPNAINDQIRRIWSLKAQYSTQFARLVQAEIKSRMHAGGFASGGIVPLRNSTYLGNDMRAGEGGTEWAMIFPNSVVQALQDGARKNGGGGGPVIGSVTLASTESPAAQEWRLQRLIKQTVRDELRRN